MSKGFKVLIIKSPNSTFKRKNKHTIRKRQTTFIATKFIAKSPNIISLPFKVPAPRSIKVTTKIMTKMNS
jgi:hypothetical protein